MVDRVINIDMGKKCAECSKGGATDCGLCLSCVRKAQSSKSKMRSAAGVAVQQRWEQIFASAKRGRNEF